MTENTKWYYVAIIFDWRKHGLRTINLFDNEQDAKDFKDNHEKYVKDEYVTIFSTSDWRFKHKDGNKG